MVSIERVREIALALPETVEEDHHGRPSFRVAGRIFATLWDERQLNVMLNEPAVLTTVQQHLHACEELWWGKRVRGIQVQLERAEESIVQELLADAWEQTAPKRLLDRRTSESKTPAPIRRAAP